MTGGELVLSHDMEVSLFMTVGLPTLVTSIVSTGYVVPTWYVS